MSDQRVIHIEEIGRLLEDVNSRLESLKRLRFVVSTVPEPPREIEKDWLFSCMDNRAAMLENRAAGYRRTIENHAAEREARKLASRRQEVDVLYIGGERQ